MKILRTLLEPGSIGGLAPVSPVGNRGDSSRDGSRREGRLGTMYVHVATDPTLHSGHHAQLSNISCRHCLLSSASPHSFLVFGHRLHHLLVRYLDFEDFDEDK